MDEKQEKQEQEEKQKVIDSYLAKNSKAQMLDKMLAAGLEAVDISAIQRLPISIESQFEIVNHILYEKALQDQREAGATELREPADKK